MKKEKKRKKEPVNFLYNLSVYWSFLRNYKLLFFIAAAIALLNEALTLTEKILFKYVIDEGNAYGDKAITLEVFTTILLWIALIYVCAVILKAGVKWLSIHAANKLDANLITDVKQRFFNHILTLSHNFHVTHKTGSLISRIGRGAGAVERMTDFITFNIFSKNLTSSLRLILVFIKSLAFSSTRELIKS